MISGHDFQVSSFILWLRFLLLFSLLLLLLGLLGIESISQELVICPRKTATVFYGFHDDNNLD